MKNALVVSGGGSKGAFAVGVLKELFQTYSTLNFDIFVGTSTGSLVTSLASVGKMDLLEKLYTQISNRDVFKEGKLGDRLQDVSIYDATPLSHLIQNNFSDADYAELSGSDKKIFLNTVCLQTKKLHVFTNDASAIKPTDYVVRQTQNANHFRRAMLASCCQPVFMQPIKIDKELPNADNPEYQYVDGGVMEYAGIRMAIDAGASNILVILLSSGSEETQNRAFKNLVEILEVTIDILVSDVGQNDVLLADRYNQTLKYLDEVKTKMRQAGISDQDIENSFSVSEYPGFRDKKPLNILTIRPDKPLGGGMGGLEFDPAEMREMLARGRLISENVVSSGGLKSFLS